MATGNIALSNTINVSLSANPLGLGDYSTNSIVLLSNEKPLSSKPYIWAVNYQDIVNEYGSNSLTAKMAKGLFNPAFNLRTGGGQVLVFPYTATNATSCYVNTVAMTEQKISALKLITNGDLTIVLDGQINVLTGLDFSTITTVEDIATILNNWGLDCDISTTETGAIQFKSRRYGLTGSTVELTATEEGTGVDLYGSDYIDGANAVTVSGTDATGTTIEEALIEVDAITYAGGVISTQYCQNDLTISTATSIQALDHIYYEVTRSLKNMAVLGASIKSAGLDKTRLIAYSGESDAKQAIATYATIASSTNYQGADTVLTMNLKTLTGIEPDYNLDQTYYNLAKDNGVDIYGNTEGLSVVYSFDNTSYTDEATGKLWLKKALEVAGFNYLRKTNTKIPQTESAMSGLRNAYEQKLAQGVRNGMIAPGAWNDAIPFGNPEDFLRNIEEKGYYIYSLPIVKQSQTEREKRIAPVVQIAIKLSGAIHSSNVIVNIQR